MKLAEDHGHTRCRFYDYDGLGHILSLPYDPPQTTDAHGFFPKMLVEMGGASDMRGHVGAQKDVWRKTLHFLSETLNGK